LLAAAEHNFRLSLAGEDGVSYGDKLRYRERTTGKHHPHLDGPAIPKRLAYLWEWFQELESARTGTGFGPNPITFAEIKAWSELTGRSPRPHEIRVLKSLDLLRLKVWSEK
jgi:hypothetical protein